MINENISQNLQITSEENVAKAISNCFVNDRTIFKILRTLAYSLLIVVSLTGNSLIIAVVRRDKKTKPTVNYFIQNMAVADLLITVVYMPRMMSMVFRGYEWSIEGTIGLVLCKLVPICHHAAILVSIQTLVVISIERFLAIVYPLKRNISKTFAKILVVLSWFFALGVRIPRLLSLTTRRSLSTGKLFCVTETGPSSMFPHEEAKQIYYQVLFFLFYTFPGMAIFVINSVIVATLIRRKPPGNHVSSEEQRRQILNRRVFRMLFMVTCLFVVCWIMYFILQILNVKFSCPLNFVRLLLAHTNSALTPCLYFACSSNYRNAVRKTFRSRNRKKYVKDLEINSKSTFELMVAVFCQTNKEASTPVLNAWKNLDAK